MHSTKKPLRPFHPVADRIRAWCAEEGVSLRGLALAARLDPTTVQKVCRRLETTADGDVGIETLTAIAKAMGRSLAWLLFGSVVVRDLPGWQEAAREAVDRFGVAPGMIEAIGGWQVHAAPPQVDVVFVVSLARLWSGGQ